MNSATTRLAFAAVLVCAAQAVAGIDLEVGNGDQIAGTLSPASEVETFRVRIPNGAKFSVKGKPAKKGPALHVTVTDPAAGAAGVADGKAPSIAGVAAMSGVYVVAVSSQDGTSTGDYTLTISWKSATSFSTSPVLAPGATGNLPFAADAGATATFAAKPAKRSQAGAILGKLTKPDHSVSTLGSTSIKFTLTLGGDYVADFKNSGTAEGGVTATVKLKPPKASKRKIGLTSKVIGSGSADGDPAFAAFLGASGGAVSVPALPSGDPGAPISGASVTIPPGALGAATAVFIATAPDLKTPADLIAAGPPVFFGPEGLTFDAIDKTAHATVSIPYDPTFDTATAQLVVYTRDAKGKVKAVPPPYTFDPVAHTVTFATSHFSSFEAAATQASAGNNLMSTVAANLTDVRDIALGTVVGSQVYPFLLAGGSTRTVVALKASAQPQSAFLASETFAGGGASTTDGTPRLQFQFGAAVTAVASGGSGNVIWVATPTQIFFIDDVGAVSRYAGTGATGSSGDGGSALAATFTGINSIAVDSNDVVYVCDGGAHRIRVIDSVNHGIQPFAGTGASAFGPDGVALAATTFLGPSRIALSTLGTSVYVADGARVRRLDATGAVNVTVAGDDTGATGSGGDGGPLRAARFQSVTGLSLAIDSSLTESIMVTDAVDHTVRLLNPTADTVKLLAGRHGQRGNAPDISLSTGLIDTPGAVLSFGAIAYFVDQHGTKIRVITMSP